MQDKRIKTNYLGVLATLAAIAAVVVQFIPSVNVKPIYVAGGAGALAVLALFISMTSRRLGIGAPLFAIIASLLSAGFLLYRDGSLNGWLPSPPPPPAAAPAGPSAPPVADAPVLPHSGSRAPRSNNIFGIPTDDGDSRPLPPSVSPSSNGPAGNPAVIKSPTPSIPLPPPPNLADVKARYDSAMRSVDQKLASDPAYAQAKKDLADADAAKKTALGTDGAGSSAVIQAATASMQARDRLRKMRDAAIAADPAASAAQKELNAAQKAPGHN